MISNSELDSVQLIKVWVETLCAFASCESDVNVPNGVLTCLELPGILPL